MCLIHFYLINGIEGLFLFLDYKNLVESDSNVKIILLPQEKNETDLFACALDGLLEGFKEFTFVFCTGGRLDHFMGALAILEYLNSNDASGIIIDSKNIIMFLKDKEIEIINDDRFKYLSIMPLDEKLIGVTTQGLKYKLDDENVLRELGLSISNEIVESTAKVKIRKGSALIIRSFD